jgi:predicted transcriptional regulator
VDNKCAGRPSCRCWISSFATEPTMSAYQPSKYDAVNSGSISIRPVWRSTIAAAPLVSLGTLEQRTWPAFVGCGTVPVVWSYGRRRQDGSRAGQAAIPTACQVWWYQDILIAMSKAEAKSILLRLDPELADQLQTVADVEGRSVSEVAREAITNLVAGRRTDRKFQRKLRENLDRQASLLGMLAEDEQ